MSDQSQHRYSALLILVFAILVLIGAVMLTFAYSRVISSQEYKNGNQKSINAKNALLWGFILGYIAAGVGIALAILYFGHIVWGIGSELPHLILFILLFLLLIGAIVAGAIALSNLHSNEVAEEGKSASGFIWAGIISIFIGGIVLLISGVWRAQYVATNKSATVSQTETTYSTVPVAAPSSVVVTSPVGKAEPIAYAPGVTVTTPDYPYAV